MPFHAARSRTSMPLRNAMPYIVSPLFTTTVLPGFGVETRGGGDEGAFVRYTVLLPHAASANAQAAAVPTRRIEGFIRRAPSTRQNRPGLRATPARPNRWARCICAGC